MLNGTLGSRSNPSRDWLEFSARKGAAANLAAALELASAGNPIFPARITYNEKTGRWDKRPYIKHWRANATTDLEQIRRWWRDYPDAVPGIELCRAGYLVIDADRHGGPDGVAIFAEIVAAHGGLPAHPQTNTPGEGEHHVFRQPNGERFGNSRGALPDGIDVRGDGGWIVAPGAVRPDGRLWAPVSGSPSLADAPPVPEWLAAIIRSRPVPPPGNPPSSAHRSAGREAHYARQALRGAAYDLSRKPVGSRNEALNGAAYHLGRMVARGWIDQTDVVDELSEAAIASGLDVDEVQQTLASGLSAGLRNPAEDIADRPFDARGYAGRSGGTENTGKGDFTGPNWPPRSERHLISRCAADIPPENIEFLWSGRLARGKHTAVAGEPGDGKSQLSVYIAAVITTGGNWPCGEGYAPVGNVIILNAEDGPADTIVPRLMAAGADLDRVHIVTAVRSEDGKGRRAFNLQGDLALLEQAISTIGDVALVIIDPISSYMGKTDSYKNAEVRGVLEPASEMAERMRVAILSITHFSKGNANSTTKALHRFIGSIAFTGAPRAAFAVIEDPDNDGRMLLLHAKNNIAPKPQGLAYRLAQKVVGEPDKRIMASFVVWDDQPVAMTADQAMATITETDEDRGALREAMDFLCGYLGGGWQNSEATIKAAGKAGIAERTLKRARAALKVKAMKSRVTGNWVIALPGVDPEVAQECQGGQECQE